MARIKTAYQTIGIRGSVEQDLDGAPYFCRDKKAWLGPGYYLWDHDLRLAHMWGENHCKNHYRVVQFQLSFDERCLDLLDPEGRTELETAGKQLASYLGIGWTSHRLCDLILLLRQNELLPYEAIRIEGEADNDEFLQGSDPELRQKVTIVPNRVSFTFVKPTQFCLLHADALDLQKVGCVYDGSTLPSPP